ncbi:Phospholipase SGR2 [Sesamum angolense]|uniref:Phospholipase SGR2 n=1 Tax=Sesamum angolense TaxID=2727404 RepID=A0AAE2C4J1_9LAMI|nr:Phospholipase SGR2 [Sesamum angolense]
MRAGRNTLPTLGAPQMAVMCGGTSVSLVSTKIANEVGKRRRVLICGYRIKCSWKESKIRISDVGGFFSIDLRFLVDTFNWSPCRLSSLPGKREGSRVELAASVPRTEIVGKGDYFRFGMRDSLAIEASFLQGKPPSSKLSLKSSEIPESLQLFTAEEERVGVPVKGGLYEVDLVKRHCFPVYWNGENRRVVRGHWFARKGGLDWLPLREDVSEQLEYAYRSQSPKTKLKLGFFSFRCGIDEPFNHQGLHALFTGEDDTWEAWLSVDSGFSSVVGFGRNNSKLRRGYAPSQSQKPTKDRGWGDELRQQKEEEMDDYCSQVPVRHLVFMVHGIGQRLEKSNLVDDVGDFRHVTASLAERHLTSHQRGTQRVLYIPCQGTGVQSSLMMLVEFIRAPGYFNLLSCDWMHWYRPLIFLAWEVELTPHLAMFMCYIIWAFVSKICLCSTGELLGDLAAQIFRLMQISLVCLAILSWGNCVAFAIHVRVAKCKLNHGGYLFISAILCVQVSNQLNRLYLKFLKRNPGYDGKVSIYGHSLGSVLSYDILCHQETLYSPFPMEWMYKEHKSSEVPCTTTNTSSASGNPISNSGDESTRNVGEESIVSHEHNTDLVEEPVEGTCNQLGPAASSESDESSTIDTGYQPTNAASSSDENPDEPSCSSDHMEFYRSDMMADSNSMKSGVVPSDNNKDCKDISNNDKDEIIKSLREEIDLLKAKIKEFEAEYADRVNAKESTALVNRHDPESVQPRDSLKSYTPQIRYTKLDFKVDTFFAAGSPLGVFLSLRNVRIGIDKLSIVADSSIMFTCYDLYEFKEGLASRSHAFVDQMNTVRVKVLTICESRCNDGQDEESKNTPVKEERSYGSLMMERLTGSIDGRIDHVLQDKTFRHPYLSAIGSHTNYWRDYDTALFILKHLYRDIPDGPISHDEQPESSSKDENSYKQWSDPREIEDEELPLTFADSVSIKNFSHRAKKIMK